MKLLPNLQFPHIPRLFSARSLRTLETLSLAIGIFALFSLNIYATANWTPSQKPHILSVFAAPFAAKPHVELAEALWSQNFTTAALTELRVAQDLPGTQVLGAATDLDGLYASWAKAPELLEAQKTHWKQVVAERSDYRDGYIQLAAISFQQSNFGESKYYLAQALDLDPNNPIALKLLSAIPR